MLKLQENSDIWQNYCIRQLKNLDFFLGLLNNSDLEHNKFLSYIFVKKKNVFKKKYLTCHVKQKNLLRKLFQFE
ncbi:hypothetical protein BpHYR1_048875 [Brachionus plicatilis]|uniref:Uncharacterized protein n=1 Tax=Brachionus plicatilis TaxID=10195 RepID=A0A3M7R8M7_BRAPC|nr:hypothetical protein BpHYR1_048875 [Brachionus plicatilis]